MQWVGTSGYNYPEWKGSFYPEKLPAAKMLPYYAARFTTVEINYTFYRMPNEKIVAGWAAQVPPAFKLHAEGAEAHHARPTAEGRAPTSPAASATSPRRSATALGALLFQLPPHFKQNLDVFDAFLDTLPPKVTAAFEFRHDSWLDDSVYERLRARNLALCLADTAERAAPIVADRRLRLSAAARRGLSARRHRALGRGREARASTWRETFVYFKHEEEGKGPEFAAILLKELGIDAPAPTAGTAALAASPASRPQPRDERDARAASAQ